MSKFWTALGVLVAVVALVGSIYAMVRHARSSGRAEGREAVLTEQRLKTAAAQTVITAKAEVITVEVAGKERRTAWRTERSVKNVMAQPGAETPLPYDLCVATRAAIAGLREAPEPAGYPPCVRDVAGAVPAAGG